MIRTRKEFIGYFRTEIMPGIREQEREQGFGADNPLRAETWNNLTDSMVKDRQLPRCALNWDNPFDTRK